MRTMLRGCAAALALFASIAAAKAQSYPVVPTSDAVLQSNSADVGTHNLLDFTVSIGAVSGSVMLFDATAIPANGVVGAAQGLKRCWPITSNGTAGFLGVTFNLSPDKYQKGIVIAFSTGPDCVHLTASPTAFITRRFQ